MKQTRSTLKEYFAKGTIPTAANFADLIDSMLNQQEDNIDKLPNDALQIMASGVDEALLSFYRIDQTQPQLSWQIKQKPGGKSGLSVSDPSGTRLFVESSTGKVGIGTTTPAGALEVIGMAAVNDGNGYAVKSGYMQSGSLTIGSIKQNYGGGSNWTANTAGLLLETLQNTEIVVHDSQTRLASLMYYEGDTVNRLTIGRDMGWGAIGSLVLNSAVSISGALSFGAQTRQMLNLYDTHFAIGVQGNTQYFRTDKNFAWYKGGTHNDTELNAGGGTLQMSISDNVVTVPGILNFNAQVRQMINLWNANYGIGVQNGTQYFRSDKNFAWYKGGSHNDNELDPGKGGVQMVILDGNVGIGTAKPNYKLEVTGDISVGQLTDTPATGLGAKLWFNGASQNTDQIWMARYNQASNTSYLRINLGDDNGADQLQVGYTYYVDGVWRTAFYVDANGSFASSDERLKENIDPIPDALQRVKQIRGVQFDWKRRSAKEESPSKGKSFGVLAQEVEAVAPNVVSTDANGLKYVNYDALIPLLIESIKSQQAQIEVLQAETQNLTRKLEAGNTPL